MPFTFPQTQGMTHLNCLSLFGRNSVKFSLPHILTSNSPLRFPFDWKNPLGYLVAVILQYVAISYCLVFVFDVAFFGIGYCLCFTSIITKIVKKDLKIINENAASDTNRWLTINLIIEFIQSHSSLKRLDMFYFLDCHPLHF